MMRKMATSRKSKTRNRQWRSRSISVWVFDCGVQNPSVFLTSSI